MREELIEVPVGGTVEIQGIEHECIEDKGKKIPCAECSIKDYIECFSMNCFAEERTDGKDIYFVKK